jgi:sugar transferase (PEP-CTERM system associated)
VIRIFNLYVPSRTLFLLLGEIITICASFALAILICFRGDSVLIFNDGRALWKFLGVVVLAILCSHYMELYDLQQVTRWAVVYPRILMLIGILSFLLAGLTYFFPELLIGRNVFVIGLCILSLMLVIWRWVFERVIFLPRLRERVYLLGNGERAKRILEVIRKRGELGMDVIGWAGETGDGSQTCESMGRVLHDLGYRRAVDRVIVALADRRSMMPVNELLELRLSGIRVEDGTTLLEKITGKIEVDELHPSWIIFGDGFHLAPKHWFVRRIVSTLLALTLSLLTLPLIPLIALLIKLSSPGPILYRQKRVGLQGRVFDCYKFRTMRADAEADSGPTWASDDDPRITKVGRFLRRTRLDEIPQIWNVLRGEMAFVGPRPERPEFVEKLSEQIPYYSLRHMTRPGITGWAQINFGYGSSLGETKEKLRFDLYYVRNASVMLDLMIVFYTVRAVLIGRGVR